MKRVALVCAASKGLGRASAEALARDGCAVAICARGAAALDDAASAIASYGGAVLPIQADLSKAGDVDRVLAATVERFGGLDVLVTNTGGPPSGPFMTFGDAAWSSAIDSLLLSVVRLCRGAVPHMQARGGGRIIHITSISVKQPIEGLVLSNALRAAVSALAKTLSIELAPHNILVNCVAPGYTRTGRVIELSAQAAARQQVTPEEIERRTPAGHAGGNRAPHGGRHSARPHGGSRGVRRGGRLSRVTARFLCERGDDPGGWRMDAGPGIAAGAGRRRIVPAANAERLSNQWTLRSQRAFSERPPE